MAAFATSAGAGAVVRAGLGVAAGCAGAAAEAVLSVGRAGIWDARGLSIWAGGVAVAGEASCAGGGALPIAGLGVALCAGWAGGGVTGLGVARGILGCASEGGGGVICGAELADSK